MTRADDFPGLRQLLDVPLRLSVVLGRTRLSVDELVQLGDGDVVRLDRLAGEPLDVVLDGKVIARGEAVVVNGHLGIRLTEIAGSVPTCTALEDAG